MSGFFSGSVATLKKALAAIGGANLIGLEGITKRWASQTNDTNTTAAAMFVGSSRTNAGQDTIFTDHECNGALGSGYGFHCLDYGDGANGGGAIGGATQRTALADAIVGNRRGTGPGNGVYGTRWEGGDGSGVLGVRRGTGAGHAVFAYKVETSVGQALQALNESTSGSAIQGIRRNGGGPGDGVTGYAASTGAGEAYAYAPLAGIKHESASVRGIKLAGDNGHGVVADGAGQHAALLAVARNNAQPAVEVLTTSTNTSLYSAQVLRENGAIGIAMEAKVAATAGARTGAVVAARAIVQPAGASTGTGIVTAQDATITSSVTGSADSRAVNGSNSATGGTTASGVVGVADGANTVNYGVYGAAANGVTNWSGYFVGRVFAGDNLTLNGGQWNGAHLIFGSVHVWVDSAFKLRIKNGAPTSDTDGTVVGAQV